MELFFVFTLTFLGIVYFLPIVVAANRNHRQLGPIAAVTILFGWTFVGWGVALVWSLTSDVKKKP